MRISEQRLHSYTVELLQKLAAPGVLWLHIPMGVKAFNGSMAGAWAKAMGARKGAADFLLIKAGRAVFLELKIPGAPLRPVQLKFAEDARAAGADFHVARTPEEVTTILRDLYLIRDATIAA